jgi:hypothetical protein
MPPPQVDDRAEERAARSKELAELEAENARLRKVMEDGPTRPEWRKMTLEERLNTLN